MQIHEVQLLDRKLQVKSADGYVTDDGQIVPPHNLYRYVDENGKGGCWYASPENAEKSWQRRVAS